MQPSLAPENGWYVADQPTSEFSGINIEVQNNTLFVSKFNLDDTWTSGSGTFQDSIAQVQMVKTNPDNTTTPEGTDTYSVNSNSSLSINNLGIHRLNFKDGTDSLNSLEGLWTVSITSPILPVLNEGSIMMLTSTYTDPQTNTSMTIGAYSASSSVVGISTYPAFSNTLGNNVYIGIMGSGISEKFFIAILNGLNHMIGVVSNDGAPIEFASLSSFMENASFFVASRMYDVGKNLSTELGDPQSAKYILANTPNSQLSVLMTQLNALADQINTNVNSNLFDAVMTQWNTLVSQLNALANQINTTSE
ncbi:hypothetical protein [Candidatus Nitrosacidococcus sp. I8]|uniref:hypothetical protein n=1 Tax=Candidatus Nitrosacidococcus sp. I8 TaxID=2942908 RepID=UPI0022276073|nr:hypothetical protein [Candidatus Nitrosacidococcus sp. I8]CAH9019249.1 hypothetical protein NURINAE_01422 [Candidatus Nitrosacidococcus sp. I8]